MVLPKEFKVLEEEILLAYHDLQEYEAIYMETDSRMNLLNSVSSQFFYKLYELYWHKFITTIGRLTDPAGKGNNRNLSIFYLEEHFVKLDEGTIAILKLKLKDISEEAKQIRKFRSKLIVHKDLKMAVLYKGYIGRLDIKKVEKVLNMIGECLNIFTSHVYSITNEFPPMVSYHGARLLVRYLEEGVNYAEVKRQRKNSQLDVEESKLYPFPEEDNEF